MVDRGLGDKKEIPNTAMPVDIDSDGDFGVLAAARRKEEMYILENRGTSGGEVIVRQTPIRIEPADGAAPSCRLTSNAFQSAFGDIDGDGRPDLVVSVTERCGDSRAPMGLPALGWLRQPADLSEPWTYVRIGDTLPDAIAGITLSDLDGDGDLDAVTGGYSGLNILDGGYSGDAREEDSPGVTPSSTVGRIAWFENPGDTDGAWARHDISRRVRGMYDGFIARDIDRDGDMDMIATRGNSGVFDGVFWLEQVRSRRPRAAFTPTRPNESRALSLPPAGWIERYDREKTFIPPNKRAK